MENQTKKENGRDVDVMYFPDCNSHEIKNISYGEVDRMYMGAHHVTDVKIENHNRDGRCDKKIVITTKNGNKIEISIWME